MKALFTENAPVENIDDALDEIDQLLDEFNNRLSLNNLRFAERYLKGELLIVIHYSEENLRDNSDYFAVFKIKKVVRNFHDLIGDDFISIVTGNGEVLDVPGQVKATKQKDLMFIENVEFMENGKPFVSSIMRLESPDQFYRTLIGSLYFSNKRGLVINPVVNRECDISTGAVNIHFNELIDHKVKGRSEIMDAVTYDCAPLRRDITNKINRININPFFLIEMSMDKIRVTQQKLIPFNKKIIEVLFGPFNFNPRAQDGFMPK